jgi:Ca2+-binding RTX toxin-like protein
VNRLPISLIGLIAFTALAWPSVSAADHIKTSAQVSAIVTKQKGTTLWVVEFAWTASCYGAEPGTEWYDGHLYMVDAETGERIYVGGVVNTEGRQTVTEKKEWWVSAKKRPQHLVPELTIGCFQNFPLHGGPDVTVTGNPIVVPPIFGDGTSGGGGGSGGGAGGGPTEPLAAGGCVLALLGTDGADRLTGGEGHEVIVGFAAGDRIRALGGHDCAVGGPGRDRIDGGRGNDRLTGGTGRDVLVDRFGDNAFDAGSGKDSVYARNGSGDLVRCGPGRDHAQVDRRDRLRGCELVTYAGRIPEVS